MYFLRLFPRRFQSFSSYKHLSNTPAVPPIKFPEKKINIKIGRPVRDINVEVSYVDTFNETKPNQPVAFMIHGTPGTYHDYVNQIPYLTEKGIRVIAPTYPAYRFIHETNRRYHHSPECRANFTRDFLECLNISKIDLLVSHSSAVYPALHLTCQSPPKIGSLALINSATTSPSKVVSPLWLNYLLTYGGFYLPSYYILRFMLPLVQLRSPVKPKDIDHIIFATTTIMTGGFEKVHEMVKTVKDKKLPSLLIYSLNDRLFEPPVYRDYINQFGLQKDDVWTYDDKGNLESKGGSETWMKIIELKNGTHYGIWKYPDIVNSALVDLINKAI